MDNQELIEKIKNILNGIDKTESESEFGWWETSAGAKFGEGKLNEIINLLSK